ncbi:ABC-type transport system involved in multi-copper enzyme maturation, permease component [Streptomyces sp. DI166]|uniref:ABC transporter permease n=1 Tax=Streptomyces sp. DI166 TaxID=1839783 RepID=UPI0007F47902|nr:ABC transporter permease [Streptomyces sp. DI166]SBT90111.1 ABC-type transport system involved in multi-copper enzyme maturation, permease component [Streptomyces sp. DI166]
MRPSSDRQAPGGGPRDFAAAEWTKLRSLRSTWALLALGTVLTVLVSLLFCALIGPEFRRADSAQRRALDPVGLTFTGLQFGQVPLVILAVMAVGNEYGTGMIRTSLAAIPRRGALLTAKLAVLGATGAVWGLLTGAVALTAGSTVLGASVPLHTDAVRALAGAGAYTGLLAVLAAALTFMVRRSLTALGVLLPFLFVVSGALAATPQLRSLARLLPDRAGLRLTQVHQDAGDLSPAAGGGVLLLWAAVAATGSYVALRRQDC